MSALAKCKGVHSPQRVDKKNRKRKRGGCSIQIFSNDMPWLVNQHRCKRNNLKSPHNKLFALSVQELYMHQPAVWSAAGLNIIVGLILCICKLH